MSDVPEGLVPAEDGTFYGPAWAALKADFEVRTFEGDEFVAFGEGGYDCPVRRIVQARPKQTERVLWCEALGRTHPRFGRITKISADEADTDPNDVAWIHGGSGRTAWMYPVQGDGTVEVKADV